MRLTFLGMSLSVLCSCVPGKPLSLPSKIIKDSDKSENAAAPLQGEELGTQRSTLPLPDDPREEKKASEPAIIGGSYLYCDAPDNQPTDQQNQRIPVSCGVGNVATMDWAAADKNMIVMNRDTGSAFSTIQPSAKDDGPYQIQFEMESGLQSCTELQVESMLAQGLIKMGSSVNPMPALPELRKSPGLVLYAATGTAGNWPGIDSKSWNLWMPVKIPESISRLDAKDPAQAGPGSNGGPGPKKDATMVELHFDDTICTYKASLPGAGKGDPKAAKGDDYWFESCTRKWLPDQWVRVKALSLMIVTSSPDRSRKAASVVLQAAP